MIIVTGGAGFIGSNLIRQLNASGHNNILVVDDLKDGHKFTNLVSLNIADYIDKDEFIHKLSPGFLSNVEAVFHQGACSSTTEWNGKYMMQTNYEYSKQLLEFANQQKTPFIYASSAAVYGGSHEFKEAAEYEKPLNIYGYSKLLFDQWIRRHNSRFTIPVVGLRYFNVYGPGEAHKGSMSSVAYHFNEQIKTEGICRLFAGSDGYANGEQKRDFIYVDDVVKVNLWFLDHQQHSGIFNVGTGKAQTFNEVAESVIAWHQQGKMEYIPFPKHLQGAYQSYTQADISALRKIGYRQDFVNVEIGVKSYLDRIN